MNLAAFEFRASECAKHGRTDIRSVVNLHTSRGTFPLPQATRQIRAATQVETVVTLERR
jgi:hypothetical protein